MWHQLLKGGSFWFCCPALGCSPWVGLLLRWSHSCLFVECPYFVPRPSSHPQRPLSLSLSYCPLSFYPQTLLPLRGSGRLDIWEKVMLFVTFFFSSCFFSLFSCCAGMHDGKREGNSYFASVLLFIILWTNSSRGLGKGEGTEGEGE